MRNDTDYPAGDGYPDAPPADPELANAEDAEADPAEERLATDDEVGLDDPVTDGEPSTYDEQVYGGPVATDPEPAGFDTPAEDSAVADDSLLTDDSAVAEDEAVADDSAVAGDDVLADDTAVADDAVLAGDTAAAGDEAVADDDEAVAEDDALVDDGAVAGLDEADDENEAGEYDDALDAEPVTDRDADLGLDDATGDAVAEDDVLATDDAVAADYAEEPVTSEDQPVVDSFEDDGRGADPYAIPEPADTSADATDQVLAQDTDADELAGITPADEIPADEIPADGAVLDDDADTDAGPDEDVAYAGGPEPALAGTEALAYGAGAGALYAATAPAYADETVVTDEAVVADEAVGADEAVADSAVADESEPAAEMMPGDADAGMAPMAVVIPADSAEHLRSRWQQLQLRFIDNPRGTADEAQVLVGEVVDTLTAALNSQRDALDDWQSSTGTDTEIFRAAVMRYRDFFDRLLSL